MVYVTGDTHRNFSRFSPDRFPAMRAMTEADTVIICGDCGWTVDYIITHSPPSGLAERLDRPRDELTDFLEEIRQKASYRSWMFGHCHRDQAIDEKHLLLWEQVVRVI